MQGTNESWAADGACTGGARVRIAVVNHHLRDVVGGSELQCHLVASGLTARGHDVTYLAIGSARDVEGREPYAVRPVAHAPDAVARALVELAPDVVYWRFNRRGLREAARALHEAGIPLVVALAHVDDVARWPSWPWPARGASLRDRASDLRSRMRHRRARSAYRHVAAIASQRTEFIGQVRSVALHRQRHVANVMDPAQVAFDWPRPYVAWVGNLKARKRPELCLDIARALAPHGIDLVVAGPVQDERYRWLTRPVPHVVNLHHVGQLTPAEVTGLVAGARALAVTSMPEGFSNVMIQAWWGGTPTVTLEYDPDGLVGAAGLGAVADGDVERFLAETVRIARDEDGAGSAAGVRAARLARERFAQGPILDRLEALLAEVVEVASV